MAIAFHKKFIAGVVSIAVLITSVSANQAQASDYRTERALAAILGLAVVGAIIAEDKKKDRKRRKAEVARQQDIQRQTQAARQRAQQLRVRPLPQRVQRNLLPSQCLRRLDTPNGPRRIFGLRCMNRNFAQVRALPQNCERLVQTPRGARAGWSARCLRRSGYQIARF